MLLFVFVSVQRRKYLHLNFNIDLTAMQMQLLCLIEVNGRKNMNLFKIEWQNNRQLIIKIPLAINCTTSLYIHCQADNVITNYMKLRLCYISQLCICMCIVYIFCRLSPVYVYHIIDRKREKRTRFMTTTIVID